MADKPTKNRKGLYILGVAVVLVLACIGCGVIGAIIGSNTPGPTATPVPTNTPHPSDTPRPTDTPAPTNTPIYAPADKIYPTASATLYEELLANKKTMTDLQFKEYLNGLIGSRVHLRAKVNEVHEDGEIFLGAVGGGFFDFVYLRGVPKAIAIKLNKGQVIEFDATIREFTDFLGFNVYLDEPVIYTIE